MIDNCTAWNMSCTTDCTLDCAVVARRLQLPAHLGGLVGAAAAAGVCRGAAPPADTAAGTAPERSALFLAFMSSVTRRSPAVTEEPCSQSSQSARAAA
jgi:hypothetical protein